LKTTSARNSYPVFANARQDAGGCLDKTTPPKVRVIFFWPAADELQKWVTEIDELCSEFGQPNLRSPRLLEYRSFAGCQRKRRGKTGSPISHRAPGSLTRYPIPLKLGRCPHRNPQARARARLSAPAFRFVDTPPFRRVFLQGCSVSNVRSIYLYCDPEMVICPLELVRDPVRGGRTRLFFNGGRIAVT
jgi:hypothetical protein